MARTPIGSWLVLTLLMLALAGCANRGIFGPTSCAKSSRMPVYGNAVAAIYFDIHGNPIGTRAEELKGTLNDKMCPTPEAPEGPDVCAPYCLKQVSGKNYCLPC